MRLPLRLLPGLAGLVLVACSWAWASDDPDLSDYRTVDMAITTNIDKAEVSTLSVRAFLGVEVALDAERRVLVQEVAADSPASRAGVERGDQILRVGKFAVTDDLAFYDLLRDKVPGETVKLLLNRQTKQMELTAILVPISRPLAGGRQQAVLGVEVVTAKDGLGLAIEQVAPASAAQKADLKPGDVILRIDDATLNTADKLVELIAAHKPGDAVTVTLAGPGSPLERKVVLGGEQIAEKKPGGWDTRTGMSLWKKPVYHLAVICIEYPDQKHNTKITAEAWQESFFSTGTYTKKNILDKEVYGSVNDFYLEQSYGKIRIEGKVFDFVEVAKKRDEYARGRKDVLFGEAIDKLLAREGKEALAQFDGVFFLYAGSLPQGTTRGGGSLYWPHRASVNHGGKRWPYFIVAEGGDKMANISVFAHEFGHMLGLPDLYARPEAPGLEGLGQWCLMSNQVGNGRPQHASAWCKERLGWVEPVVIDPTVKQKLILRPIEDSYKDCLKVLIHRDGSEYLLLENRIHKGFDKSLPGEGLLIWRVVRGQPFLVGSHGIEGAAVSRVFPKAVPYPSDANHSLTPYTVPSSRSKLGGGLPVYITNIRRLPDGRVSLHLGYEYE
jgi:M6 family metalloprotease-like protein